MIDRETLDYLLEEEKALVLEDHKSALIGIGNRCGQPSIAVYDRSLLVKSYMKKHNWTEDDADEWVSFNIEGVWDGESSPMIIERLDESFTGE